MDLDKGDLSDEQDQVIASAHDSFAKTAAEFKNKLNQVVQIQGKGASGDPATVGGVQDARGGNGPTCNMNLQTDNPLGDPLLNVGESVPDHL